MKSNIGSLLIAFALGMLVMYFIMRGKTEIVEVPIKIEVPVPVVTVEHDTVYVPTPVPVAGERIIDTTYYQEYQRLKDDREAQDSLFKKAIEIKEYNERVEDDTLKIDLYAKVRGDLLSYQIGYETKPRTINLDTTIAVAIPRKPELYLGAMVSLPTNEGTPALPANPGVGPQAILVNRKHNKAFTGSWDVINKRVSVGITFKF